MLQTSLFELSQSIGNGRVENDFYPTPEPITKALLDRVAISGNICEPCAGDCAIAEVIFNKIRPLALLTNDPYMADTLGVDMGLDATNSFSWARFKQNMGNRIDWTITNPPFNCATEILRNAWRYSDVGCAFLLRLSYCEPVADRSNLLRELADHQTLFMPVNPRPKFRRDNSGTDSSTVAWFVWDKRWSWKAKGIPCPFDYLTGWK